MIRHSVDMRHSLFMTVIRDGFARIYRVSSVASILSRMIYEQDPRELHHSYIRHIRVTVQASRPSHRFSRVPILFYDIIK